MPLTKTHGLLLIERNYNTTPSEIDLIMKDIKTTVFIDVRYCRNIQFGSGAESVNYRKQQKSLATAAHYLHQIECCYRRSRFDVISLTKINGEQQLDKITNALHA